MLAKAAAKMPSGDNWLYEPKWDGFRALIFRDGDDLYIQSRDLKPLERYFPELTQPLLQSLPERCVLDGEVVVAVGDRLDFTTLQMRIHPAKSRVTMLAEKYPADYVAFDILALDDRDLRDAPLVERRGLLEAALADAEPPVHLTPATRDRDKAQDWFERFEGAGLDGVIAKGLDTTYQPKKRAMTKIKPIRSADCVVAGFRWHKNGPGTLVGSLLLGVYDGDGALQHLGVTSSFTMKRRAELVEELAPLREDAMNGHPWESWASADRDTSRKPGAQSRWSAGKNLSWEPLRIERVAEVKFDHLERGRFRHTTTFLRWRTDKAPASCGFDQFEVTPPYEVAEIFKRNR